MSPADLAGSSDPPPIDIPSTQVLPALAEGLLQLVKTRPSGGAVPALAQFLLDKTA